MRCRDVDMQSSLALQLDEIDMEDKVVYSRSPRQQAKQSDCLLSDGTRLIICDLTAVG